MELQPAKQYFSLIVFFFLIVKGRINLGHYLLRFFYNVVEFWMSNVQKSYLASCQQKFQIYH